MPTACFKQAFMKVALARLSCRRSLASEIFLTSLQTAFFNNLLVNIPTVQ